MVEVGSDRNSSWRKVARALAHKEYDCILEKASPELCVHLLAVTPNLKLFSKLHRKLKSSDKDWSNGFLHSSGLVTLLSCVDVLCSSSSAATSNSSLFSSLLIAKCVCCLKELLNLKHGMESIIEIASSDASTVNALARGIL
jgi:hypothetical protein